MSSGPINPPSSLTTSPRRGSTVRSLFVRRRFKDIVVKNIDKIEELSAYISGKYIEPSTGYKRKLTNKARKDAVIEDTKSNIFLSLIFTLIGKKEGRDTGLKEQIENINQGESIWAKIKSGKVDEVSMLLRTIK